MKITGKNLMLVQHALELADEALHTRKAMMPDVHEYAEAIDEIEEIRIQLKCLLVLVERALMQEGIRGKLISG